MLNLFKYIIIPDKAFKFEGEYGLNLCTKHDAWGMQESKTHRFLALENYTLKIKSLNYFPVVQQKRIHCQCRRLGFDPWVRKIPWRMEFLPGKIHGQKSLAGYSPWVCKRVGHDLATNQQQKLKRIIGLNKKRWNIQVEGSWSNI